MSFRYIGPGGPVGHRAQGTTYHPCTLRQAEAFFCLLKTTEVQMPTKIHLAWVVFLSVTEKDLSWYMYCFMGVKPHSVQIRCSKPQGLHIITKVDAVNPNGCTLSKHFMVAYFTDHLSEWTSLTCCCAQSYRQHSQATRLAHFLEQEIVKRLYIRLLFRSSYLQHDFIWRQHV